MGPTPHRDPTLRRPRLGAFFLGALGRGTEDANLWRELRLRSPLATASSFEPNELANPKPQRMRAESIMCAAIMRAAVAVESAICGVI